MIPVDCSDPNEVAKGVFREHGGILSTSQALERGVHPRTLYALRDSGALEQLSYGLYRLAELPPLAHPDLVTVALRAPQGVLCLVSALAFYDLTTEVPHEVYLAVARGTEPPRINEVPLRLFWFGGPAYHAGIQHHTLDGVAVAVYAPEKTLADMFKYRHKLGLDVALEALKLYKQRKKVDIDALLKYARVCRVERVMRPYLEMVLT